MYKFLNEVLSAYLVPLTGVVIDFKCNFLQNAMP